MDITEYSTYAFAFGAKTIFLLKLKEFKTHKRAHKSNKLAQAYLSARLNVWDITKAKKIPVVFMLFSLFAPDLLADVTQNDEKEIFVVDMEDVCCAKL